MCCALRKIHFHSSAARGSIRCDSQNEEEKTKKKTTTKWLCTKKNTRHSAVARKRLHTNRIKWRCDDLCYFFFSYFLVADFCALLFIRPSSRIASFFRCSVFHCVCRRHTANRYSRISFLYCSGLVSVCVCRCRMELETNAHSSWWFRCKKNVYSHQIEKKKIKMNGLHAIVSRCSARKHDANGWERERRMRQRPAASSE